MRISRQSLGVAGAVVLALGVFAPIVRMPLVGDINYFRRGDGDGAIVLVLAAIAAGLALAKRCRWILLPAGLALGMIGYTYVDIQVRLHDARTLLDGFGPLRQMGDLVVDAIQLQWGWVVMLAGVVLLGAAALKPEREDGETDAATPGAGSPGGLASPTAPTGSPSAPASTPANVPTNGE